MASAEVEESFRDRIFFCHACAIEVKPTQVCYF